MAGILIIVSIVFIIGVLARVLSKPTLWEGVKTLLRAGILVVVVVLVILILAAMV